MDWTQIVIALLGIVGAFDLGRIMFFKANKKKANAEADNIVIEGMEKTIAAMSSRIESDEEAMNRKDAKIEELYEEKNRTREDLASAQTLMCIHMGCAVRKPVRGQGAEWLRDHKSDPALGVDYLPINQLIRQYGETKKRNDGTAPAAEKEE